MGEMFIIQFWTSKPGSILNWVIFTEHLLTTWFKSQNTLRVWLRILSQNITKKGKQQFGLYSAIPVKAEYMRLTVVWSDKDRGKGISEETCGRQVDSFEKQSQGGPRRPLPKLAGKWLVSEAICAWLALALATEMCVRGRCRQIRDAPLVFWKLLLPLNEPVRH